MVAAATALPSPYFARCDAMAAQYPRIASSFDIPLALAHASHFERPVISVIPGRDVFTSPAVACVTITMPRLSVVFV